MSWLRRLFSREPRRNRADVELARLDVRAVLSVNRSDRATAEAEQLAETLRNTVKAMRADQRRW